MSGNNTCKSAFVTNVSDFFVNSASKHLSDWLRENKDVTVTPEELCKAFDVTFRHTPLSQGTPLTAQMPNVPPYCGTGATPPKRRGGRQKKVTDPNAKRCEYAFTRGANVGKKCGKVVLNDGQLGSDRYCKGCITKKAVQKSLSDDTDSKGNGVPRPSHPEGMVSPVNDAGTTTATLEVNRLDNGLLVEKSHGFVVEVNGDDVVARGVMVDDKIKELTNEDRALALSLGISIVETEGVPAQSFNLPGLDTNIPAIPEIGLAN